MNSVLLTVLAIMLQPAQADPGEPEGSIPHSSLPVSISGDCLPILYTLQQTFKSKEWITEFSAHSWSHDNPVAIFTQQPSEPGQGTSNYYKPCNVMVFLADGINTLPKIALLIRKSILRNDFIVIIDHVSVSDGSLGKDSYVKSAMRKIKRSLIYTRLLTVPQNLLFLLEQYETKQNVSLRSMGIYSYSPTLRCQKIPKNIAQLKISAATKPWALSVLKLNGFPVFLTIDFDHFLAVPWREIGVATLRGIVVYGPSYGGVIAQAKVISEMAAKLNFTPVGISEQDFYKNGYNAGIPTVMTSLAIRGHRPGWDFSAPNSLFQTFLYCTDKKIVDTNLLAVFNPLGLRIWLFLAISFASVCCFVKFTNGTSPWQAMVLILAPLISQSVVGQQGIKGKELMLLWNLTALVLSALYVGSIKSLLVVPMKQERLKTFEDLVKNEYHIQMRGNASSTYFIMKYFLSNDSAVRSNKHLVSLANTAEFSPEDHQQYLDHLVNGRKRAAMNKVATVDNYLRYLHKYYTRSECLKGEELMFVVRKGDAFLPPYSELLRKASDQLFESGISQMYEGIEKGWRRKYDDNRLMPTYWNVSADGKSRSSDFSLDHPQGKITFYLGLIGSGLGVALLWAEILWNPIKLAGKSMCQHIRRSSGRVWYRTPLFIRSLLPGYPNQDHDIIRVQTGPSSLAASVVKL